MIKIKKDGVWHEIHDASKQDKLSTEQQAAVNSGITSTEVTQIGTNTTAISGLDTRLGTAETAITEKAAQADLTALTTRVGTNETNITTLQSTKADTTSLDSYILKTAVDGTTIKFEDNVLKAILPKSMVFKGSEEFVSVVLAKTGMEIGDTWFAEKDDRKTPEEPSSPIVNALITYSASGWVYVGDTSIDLSEYAKQTDLDALDGKVSTMEGTISTLDSTVSTHTTEIAAKADQTSLDTTNENLGQLHTDFNAHTIDTEIHTNQAEKDTWNGKQDAIEGAQLQALESGITAEKVGNYDAYAGQISTNTSNIQAINDSEVMKSGITSTKVSTYDGYATTIAGKQKQITYSETEPTGSADGDVWVF